jgi:hypothetical protein
MRIQGPGVPPELGFACCDQGIAQMQALFASQEVIAGLEDLHAELAIQILDFAPERAGIVRRLNQAGIPLIAWIVLQKEEGFYLNVDNAPQVAARVAAFEKWSNNNGLKWAGVGLDIEPNFGELEELRAHRWRLITTLLHRSLDGNRIIRARDAYAMLIRHLQSQRYPVQIYQMPYIPAERSLHSSVLDRLLGTVDVRGNEEYLMLYTSFARPVGAGMIWSLGQRAEAISIGSTDGDSAAGSGVGPLNWDEFSRDLIVASHFSKHIGVYNLEGCVRQGFLPRIAAMDWSRSVTIPAESISRAKRLGVMLRIVLWCASNLLPLIVVALLFFAGFVWFWRIRKRKSRERPDPVPPRCGSGHPSVNVQTREVPAVTHYRPRGCGEFGVVTPHGSTVNPPGAAVPSEFTKTTLSTTRFSGANTRPSSCPNRREMFRLIMLAPTASSALGAFVERARAAAI